MQHHCHAAAIPRGESSVHFQPTDLPPDETQHLGPAPVARPRLRHPAAGRRDVRPGQSGWRHGRHGRTEATGHRRGPGRDRLPQPHRRHRAGAVLRPGVLPALRAQYRRRHAQARAGHDLRRLGHHGVRRRDDARHGRRLYPGADQRQEGARRRRRPLVLGGPHPGRNGGPHRDPAQRQRQPQRRCDGRHHQHRAARRLPVRRQLPARGRQPLVRRRAQPHLRRGDQRQGAGRAPAGRRQRAGPLPRQDQALGPLHRPRPRRAAQLGGPERGQGRPRLLGQRLLQRRHRRQRPAERGRFLREDRPRRHRGLARSRVRRWRRHRVAGAGAEPGGPAELGHRRRLPLRHGRRQHPAGPGFRPFPGRQRRARGEARIPQRQLGRLRGRGRSGGRARYRSRRQARPCASARRRRAGVRHRLPAQEARCVLHPLRVGGRARRRRGGLCAGRRHRLADRGNPARPVCDAVRPCRRVVLGNRPALRDHPFGRTPPRRWRCRRPGPSRL